MALEAGKLSDNQKLDKKNKTKKEELQDEINTLEFKKSKEKIMTLEDSESKLQALKEMIQNWEIDERTKKVLEKVIASADMNDEDIETIFRQIDEIENIENVDNYLPKEFRITKDEYKDALTNHISRIQVLTKIDVALTIIINQIKPFDWSMLNLFRWYLIALDKNLVRLQENHIDMKNILEAVDWKIDDEKLSLWQRFVKFLRSLFNI